MEDNIKYRIEIIKIYHDEFKYRHKHYWNLFFKMVYYIIFLFVTYFIGYDYVIDRGIDERMFLYILIISVSLLTVMSLIILVNEYVRIQCINAKFKELLDDNFKQKDYNDLKLDKLSCKIMKHKWLGQITNLFVFILGVVLIVALSYKVIII